MVTCITIELADSETVPHGAKTYESLPRIGEYIAIEESGIGFLFEVVAVAHSSSYAEGAQSDGSDLYVKRLGRETDVISRLLR